jgi:large subunit ribosomal protein L15
MELNQITDNEGARKSRMRVGRGIGSGKGKTCGQMPIHRRLPKRGFNNHMRTEFDVITLRDLQVQIDNGVLDVKQPITTATLKAAGIVPHTSEGVKILVKGELKAKVTLDVERASKSAIAAVEKLGGTVSVKEKAVYAKGKQAKWVKKA